MAEAGRSQPGTEPLVGPVDWAARWVANGVDQQTGKSLTTPSLCGYNVPMKFRVIVEPDEDGVFVAECPSLPGCISQGKTRAQALANIQDAIAGYLASLKKHNERTAWNLRALSREVGISNDQFVELL